MIKLKTPLSLVLITIFTSSILNVANATTDSTVIELSHTYTPYVNFTGTAPGASRFYDNDDLVNFIFPLTVVLGTMGLESNVGGNCDMEFSTLNDFELKHTVIPTSGAEFTINYQGQTFTKGNNPTLTTPCTTSATDISFELNNLTLIGFDNFIPSGLFKDIVTVVVTTQ
ncbi:MAG: hypothetical protein ACI88H_001538 [Cocleimonas sp.]|jgi:hypothetical protein